MTPAPPPDETPPIPAGPSSVKGLTPTNGVPLMPLPDGPRPSPHQSMAARTREIPSTRLDGWHTGNLLEGPEARACTGEWPGENRRDPRDGPTYT